MEKELIKVEILDRVGYLTIDNPPANQLSAELKSELMAKIEAMSADDNVWTVVLTGTGERFFMAGANIPGLLKLDWNSGLEMVQLSRKLYGTFAACEKPIIAAINGFCMGGGCEMALACDIRIAADHVKLGLPEVNLGLIPGGGGTQRMPRAVGPGWASYLLFTGDAITAAKAHEIGLVQEVVPFSQLRETALDIAGRINKKAPLAVRAAKRAARLGFELPIEEGLDIENKAFADCCATQDKNEGVSAFLEKRKPVFQGR
ncbi:MAG: enoyl-CoA hydratase/isomerase family protein [Proteobacteria bacterium]|nr:enoyl-CoA hydratase/isomerase family protein [Pseudomonadota bacterium]